MWKVIVRSWKNNEEWPVCKCSFVKKCANFQNVSIGIVGKDTQFTILDETALSIYLSEIEGDKRSRATEAEIQDDSKPPQDPPADQGPADPEVAGPVAMDTE